MTVRVEPKMRTGQTMTDDVRQQWLDHIDSKYGTLDGYADTCIDHGFKIHTAAQADGFDSEYMLHDHDHGACEIPHHEAN